MATPPNPPYSVTILFDDNSVYDAFASSRSEAYALIRRFPNAYCWRITFVSPNYNKHENK